MSDTRPVEIQRGDGTPTPGLELVGERRTDGPEDGPQQPRTVVVVNDSDGDGVIEVDTAQDRVGEAAQPQLVTDIIGRKLEVADVE
ncbi:hypothetical protein [Haloarcula amylovorans]|uniref:hypothetical protein n=1 Tax=Haloarcula amylovorans TaxID=2562280 RepID=UPI0010765796|nr:hypothetical protein [Halomicroarcula amylolytica]